MNTPQIATTIEQSKRLIEAGLSPDSADMAYGHICIGEGKTIYMSFPLLPGMDVHETNLPAWSLSRLIDIRGGFKIWEIDNSAELIESLVKSIIILISYGDIREEYLAK